MLLKHHNFGALLNIGSALLYPSLSNQLDALLLLCRASGHKKEYLLAHQSDSVDYSTAIRYFFLIGKRKRKIPLAYILGEKEFYNLKFKVNKNVLIPRPETEGLVELALKYITSCNYHKVIDLGTGSGCIAIALLKSAPNDLEIDAIDISQKALEIALANAKILLRADAQRIKFKVLNYLNQEITGKYDLIIANPPYVSKAIEHELEKEISFEPQMAIFAEENGLQYYYAIKDLLLKNLSVSGKALLEIGSQQYDDLFKIFKDSFNIDIKPDLTGRDRYLIISPL